MICSGPVPLWGDSEEKGDYKDGDPLWKVSGLSHILGALALGSDREVKSPDWKPVWLTEGLWKDDSTREEHIHLLIPKEGQRRLIENCITGWPVFYDPMICAPHESNECARTDKPRISIRI